MTSRTGANTFIGLAVSHTFGTAGTAGSGDKLEVDSLSHGENVETLEASPIGSGLLMQNDAQRGATSPEINLAMPMKYQGAGLKCLAQFMGNSAAPMAMGGGAYTHSFIMNETSNLKFLTGAWHGYSAGVFEYPSAAVSRVKFSAKPNDYLRAEYDLIADQQKISGTTNSAATLATITADSSYRIIAEAADNFWIGAQAGGSLSSSDQLNVTSIELELVKPLEHIHEIRGSAGNGQPVLSGNPPLAGTLTVTLKNLSDFTYFTAFQAGTEYKATFSFSGPAVGSGNYSFAAYIPRMVIVSDPAYDLTTAGENPVTLTFKILVASSNPTGMINTYPYFVVWNGKSNSYLT